MKTSWNFPQNILIIFSKHLKKIIMKFFQRHNQNFGTVLLILLQILFLINF